MPLAIELAKTTFAGGEVSPELRVRADLQKAQTGLWFLENMVVLLEGGVTRAPGSQMVLPLDAAHAYVQIPFRFSGSGSNAYNIVIGNGVAKFILGNGVVQAGGGGDYTVAVPYSDADLGGAGAVTAGVSNLRWAVEGNVVFLYCDGHPPQTLTRNADNSWTLAAAIAPPAVPIPQGGCLAPVDPENLDPAQTIGAALLTGANAQTPGATVTLAASAQFAGAAATVPNGFQAGHIGSVWRLDEADLSLIPEWTADEVIAVATQALPDPSAAIGDMGASVSGANIVTGTKAAPCTNAYAGGAWAAAQAIYSASFNGASGVDIFGGGQTAIATLYGKTGAPANGTDGTALGVLDFVTGSGGAGGTPTRTVYSDDPLSTFDHIWVYLSCPTNPGGDAAKLGTMSFAQFESAGVAVYRRFNGNVYQALGAGNAGANAPVHTQGIVLSGIGGVLWEYIHRDRGFVQILTVVSSTQATALVLEALPLSVSEEATKNWWPSAWDAIKGWPNRVKIIRNALIAARQDKGWMTQPGTFSNFDIVDPTSAQSAIEFRLISPSGSLAWIEWFMGGLYLGAGTRDEAWVLVGQDILSAITVENLSPYVSRPVGSCQHIPADAEAGLVTIDRTRTRAMLMLLAYSYFMPQYAEEELTLTARHILRDQQGALGVSHQQDPNRINWFWCRSGMMVGNTLMKEQQINGWHRHPQHAATNSAVQNIVTIPSSDEGVGWTYLQTQRTINGAPAKFIELMQPFFQPQNPQSPDASGAWFLDCALRYQGPPVPRVTGLNHLIGQAVGIHADGCMYLNADGSLPVVDAAGGITLTRMTQDAIVGLPKPYRARLLPLDLQTQAGSTAGERSKANHFFLYVVNSAGGNVSGNVDEGGVPENIDYSSDADPGAVLTYGTPVPLYTGIVRTPGLDVPLSDQTYVEVTGFVTPQGVECDTMPFTLSGIDPDVEVEEGG
jgi:hypothetical protein